MTGSCAHEFANKTPGKGYWTSPVGAELTGFYGKCSKCGEDLFELDPNAPKAVGGPSGGTFKVGTLVYRGPST